MGDALQQGAVHVAALAAAHLVPVVPRQFELRECRHLHLGQGDEVVEPGLARDLLREEPPHLLARGAIREVREERVVLAGSGSFEVLEPGDEGGRFAGRLARSRGRPRALALDEFDFQRSQNEFVVEVFAPGGSRNRREQSARVEAGQSQVNVVFGRRCRSYFAAGRDHRKSLLGKSVGGTSERGNRRSGSGARQEMAVAASTSAGIFDGLRQASYSCHGFPVRQLTPLACLSLCARPPAP